MNENPSKINTIDIHNCKNAPNKPTKRFVNKNIKYSNIQSVIMIGSASLRQYYTPIA